MKNGTRIGKFKVSRRFYDGISHGEGVNLFHNMVVLDVRYDLLSAYLEYVAIHPDFEPREDGEELREYGAHFTDKSSIPKWVEKTPSENISIDKG